MNDKIIFEQPLNERIRNLLRLEYLFNLTAFRSNSISEWDCRDTLESLLEINSMLVRVEIKTELIKELERQTTLLGHLKKNPAVDKEQLRRINGKLRETLNILRNRNYKPGERLEQDQVVTSFRQRMNIVGGTCPFDLPRFHYWLNQPPHKRKKDIETWSEDIQPVSQAVKTVLEMIRNSAHPVHEKAKAGFYQHSIGSKSSCQLARVLLDSTSPYYPEISGGKHRFTVRFMEASDTNNSRSVQTGNDVDFELHCCIL